MEKTLNRMSNATLSIFLVTSLSLLGGCDTKGKEDNCDQFHKKKTECDKYTTKAGVKCRYNDATDKCQPEAPAVVCEELDDATCQGSDQCTFDPTTTKCKEAAAGVKGTCKAYQTQTSCEGNTCKWDPTTSLCNDRTAGGPDKKIQEYTLTKIDPALFNIDERHLKGIAASGDGKFIYAVETRGAKNDYLSSLDVDTGAVDSQALSNKEIRSAHDFSSGGKKDFRNSTMVNWVPLSDGIFVWLKGKGAVQVLGGGGSNNIYAWSITDTIYGLGEFNKGADTFLLISFKAPNPPKMKMAFIKKETDPNQEYGPQWNQSLVSDLKSKSRAPEPLDAYYKQFLQYTPDQMLMLTSTGNVDLMKAANIGVANKGIMDSEAIGADAANNGVVNFIEEKKNAWRHSGKQNRALKLAVMGKFLVAIFSKTAPDTGGIGVFDTSSGKGINDVANWKWPNKDIDAVDIAVDKHSAAKDKRAVITAQNGFLVLQEDQLLNPIPGQTLINHTSTMTAPVTTYQNAASGFTAGGTPLPSDPDTRYHQVAQGKNGLFYLQFTAAAANAGGIYTLEIKDKVIPAP